MPRFPDPEQVCQQLLEAVGHIAPPTDLNAVCSLWPTLKIDEEDLDKEGYLLPLGVHGAEILIRRSDPPARKKFTLAHELGHWTQAHLNEDRVSFDGVEEPSISFRTHHKRQTPEEVWCNRFAACLLMPKRDICEYLQGPKEINLADRISRGPSVFQVSNEAFLVRITDITPINVFEVVDADGRTRIGRRFLSRHQQENHIEQTMNGLLHAFHRGNDLAKKLGAVDGCDVQTKLTRNSRSSRSWLVSVTPV